MSNQDNTVMLEPGTTTIAMTPELMELRKNMVSLELENAALKKRLDLAIEREDLVVQNTIDMPPVSQQQLYGQACSGDAITIETFAKAWVENLKSNLSNYDVKNNLVSNILGRLAYRPCICAGAGPSLRKNVENLKNRENIGLVSCLHNFGYLEDQGVNVDWYVNLDSQEITIPEVFEGGKNKEDFYWKQTEGKVLIAALVSNPNLVSKWRGKILWFNTVIPVEEYQKLSDENGLNVYFSTGGNALGASYYFARAVLGACPVALVGADFSFSHKKKFHSWDSPYDKMFSGVMPVTDIFGNRVFTWQSYYNFSKWFEFIAIGGKGNNPCMIYNCTEGGILGAYPQGNIRHIIQMPLAQFIYCFTQHNIMKRIIDNNEKSFLF